MSRELQRGRIVLKDSDWREYESYSADVAQDDYDKKATHKGPGLKIGKDHALAKHIEDKILKDKYSPDAVVMEIESGKYEFKASICTRTVYNYIDQGVFANITNKDLPREGRPKKESTSESERHSVMLGANPSVRGQKKQMSVLNTDTGRWTALSQGSAKGAAVC